MVEDTVHDAVEILLVCGIPEIEYRGDYSGVVVMNQIVERADDELHLVG